MWFLTSENDTRIIHIVSSSNQLKQVIIGRSTDNEVCNFAIADDPSISRKHATLTLKDNSLLLQDLGSRYGTFLNNSTEKVEINTNIELKENDIVKFGKMNSIWKVNVINLITCTSTLKGDHLQNLKSILSKIGGLLKNDWDETCNYLTMPAITLTIKVVLALVQGSYIVTTDFWTKCLENINNFIALPDPHDFIPDIVESTLNREVVSFQPDSRRRLIFKDKKFIFFSRRQFEMYKTVLIKSGGSPMLLSECRKTISMLCGPDVIIIQYISSGVSQESQTQRSQINDIVNQLKNKGKRVVADAEIGLAILYCSVDKYCNPNFSFTSEVVKQTAAPQKSSNILAQESQDPAPQLKKQNVRINETLMSEDSNYNKTNIKRKLSEVITEDDENPSKKLATTDHGHIITNIKSESSKRRFPEDSDDSSNPTKKIATDNVKSSIEQVENDNSSDGIFNFVKSPANNEIAKPTKKLNLSRPQKRKVNDCPTDGNLFNFVQSNDEVAENTTKPSIFNIDKNKKDVSDDLHETLGTKPKLGATAEEISAMRGSKLKELMEHNLSTINTLKKEKSEDLEDKMNKLDLCSTIVTTCNNLIKREPYKIEPENSYAKNTSVKNFKIFKKVWPVKRQVTIIQTPSMSSTAA